MKKLHIVALPVGALALVAFNLAKPSASEARRSFTVVTASVNVTGPGLNWNTDALCPSGKAAIGGGFQLNPGGITNYDLLGSSPNPSDKGWVVGLDYNGTTPFTLTAYAVCG